LFEAIRVSIEVITLPFLRRSDSKYGNNIAISTPHGTVPEHFFEKKQLVPALQQLLASYAKPQ
jgi:hypothetical protein